MNSIIHPRVASAFVRARADAEARGVQVLVHESALITEVKERDQFDAIVIVQSPLSVRIRRVTDRDGMSRGTVEARIQSQPSEQEFHDVADYVIENNGSLARLREQVRDVFAAVTAPTAPEQRGTSSGVDDAR
jgi:dephospho-CoA kinase